MVAHPIHLGLLAVVTSSLIAGAVEIGRLPNFQHGVGGTLNVLSTKRIHIASFSYDGQGPGAFLYYYRPGQSVDRNGNGFIIPVPGGNSDGSFRQGRRYQNENLVVDLPEGVDACDIGILTIWCRPFSAIFTSITIPRNIFIEGGSDPCTLVNTDLPTVSSTNFENCMFLSSTFQLSWTVRQDQNEINFRMCGCRGLDVIVNNYMGFGLSGRNDSTFMVGADATIAWVDNSDGSVSAVDYYLSGRFQCRAGEGVCPDTTFRPSDGRTCTNDITAVSGGVIDREQCVLFTRSFNTSDSVCDLSFNPDQPQYMVWAVGGIGETAFVHFSRADPMSSPITLGRSASNQCTGRSLECVRCAPFKGQRMVHLTSTTFHFRIGPGGGERGYAGITGRPGWGISWYVNGSLIPELRLQRGQTYTFIVEGGRNSSIVSRYHPLYITDSIGGGRLQNQLEQRNRERVFAGFDAEGTPTGVGRLCEMTETSAATTTRETCGPLTKYQNELQSSCLESGEPGVFTWTPDESTPSVVYYQCATHLNLGWRIVLDGATSVTSAVSLSSTTAPDTTTMTDFTIETYTCTCTNTGILSVVLTAILTALLATVIFVLVQVVVCKYQLKSRPGGAGRGISEGEQVYEQMGRDEGGVAVRGGTDPMYMEVGERKGHTFQLKENEAYDTHS